MDNRVKVEFAAENKKNLTWYHRTLVKHNNSTFGLLGVYGISQNILVKNNILFGHKLNEKVTGFLRFENEGFRKGSFNWADAKGYFNTAILDIVGKHGSNIKYGV